MLEFVRFVDRKWQLYRLFEWFWFILQKKNIRIFFCLENKTINTFWTFYCLTNTWIGYTMGDLCMKWNHDFHKNSHIWLAFRVVYWLLSIYQTKPGLSEFQVCKLWIRWQIVWLPLSYIHVPNVWLLESVKYTLICFGLP